MGIGLLDHSILFKIQTSYTSQALTKPLDGWTDLFKARLNLPRISDHFDFRLVTFRGSFLLLFSGCFSVLSLYNLKLHKVQNVTRWAAGTAIICHPLSYKQQY